MLKIAVISPNKARMEAVRQILQDDGLPRQVVLFEDSLKQLASVADRENPDLIVIDGLNGGAEWLVGLEQFGLRYPNIAIIILCENASSEFLVGAMRIGVKDVLPLTADALQTAVRRIESISKPIVAPQKTGKVIALVTSKGGCGATFLACNLGYILAATHDVKVALLDLDLHFGDATLFVSDAVPSNTLSDVASNISRLDASFLASSMVQVLPNFAVLAAPEDIERAEDVKPEHIEALLKLAKTQYDYVIIDSGLIFNRASVKALDYADVIFVILQKTLPYIRDSKRLINVLQSLGYAKDKIHLIINRYERGGDIRLEDVEATLGMKVFKTIPNSYEAVSASVNQGVPIMKLYKHDSVTKALQEVVQTLIEDSQTKKNGWLANLLHHA